jgi:acyl dehydratase
LLAGWRRRLIDRWLALIIVQGVTDVSYDVMANHCWNEVQLPTPVFEDDTVYPESESEVLEVRDSRSRTNLGVVTVATRGFNQTAS